jgi:hypothetical protein
MEDTRLIEKIIQRLDVLILLELEKAGGPEGMRPATKIFRLSELGLMPAEISDILGKPINYITATLSRRKANKGKEK